MENLFLIKYSYSTFGDLTRESKKKIEEIVNKIEGSYRLENGLYALISSELASKQVGEIIVKNIEKSEIVQEGLLWPDNDKIKVEDIKIIYKKIKKHDDVVISAYINVIKRLRTYFLKKIGVDMRDKEFFNTDCLNINFKKENYVFFHSLK